MALRSSLGTAICVTLVSTLAFAEPLRSDDPAAEAQVWVAKHCPAGVSKGFVRHRDWDGDGQKDILISTADSCDDGRTAWCGSFGCHYQLWFARPGGGYVTGLLDQVKLVLPETWQGKPAVRIVAHGEVCFRAGYEGCASIEVWDPDTEILKTVWKDH